MKQVPIKYKKVDFFRYGKTVGGFFSNGILTIEKESFSIRPAKWKYLAYFFNNSSMKFDNTQQLNIYKNQFQEYKIKYSTDYREIEVTYKMDKKYHPMIDELILQQYGTVNTTNKTNN